MAKYTAFDVDRSPTIISALVHGGVVNGLDVAWLRREVFVSGEVTREQADELFTVARSRAVKTSAWTAFFVEKITDHVLGRPRADGVVGGDVANWLIGRVDEAATREALAVLVNVLAEARRAPQWLIAAAHERADRRWPATVG
jgi:hypothetical protein